MSQRNYLSSSTPLIMSAQRTIFLLFVLCAVATQGSKADTLSVDFGIDTLHACMWEPVQLDLSVSGGDGSYTYNWNTGDSTQSIQIVPTLVSQQIIVTVSDLLGQQASDTLTIHGFPECVWPGDANGDAQANNLDLLALGLAYGDSGESRINPHFNWVGQPAPAWVSASPFGANHVHSDIDGSGMVDSLDAHGIKHNYVLPQTDSGLSPISPNGTPFYLNIDSGNYLPGDTVDIPIMLGTVNAPASQVYGVSFSITFDNSQIDSSFIQLNFDGAWLGATGQDILTIEEIFFEDGQIDIALTRFDHQPITGYGRLGDITVVIDDLILKKEEVMNIGIKHISLLDEEGNGLEVLPNDAQISIILTSIFEPGEETPIQAYPIPTQDRLHIQIEQWREKGKIEMLNSLGQVLLVQEVEAQGQRDLFWSLSQFPSGPYWLRYSSENYFGYQQILIE